MQKRVFHTAPIMLHQEVACNLKKKQTKHLEVISAYLCLNSAYILKGYYFHDFSDKAFPNRFIEHKTWANCFR